MRRSAAIICALLATGFLPLEAQQRGPSIEFDSPTKNVSQVIDGEVIHQFFKFTNNGDAQLEITGVEPACGCTSALPVPNKVAPGQSGQIKIEIKTEGFAAQSRNLAETVPMSKTVTVRTNDPKQPQVVLTVNFNVAPEIVVSEPSIYFGSNPRGQEVTKELTVEIAPNRPVKLLSAVSTDASVAVKLEPLAGGDDKKFRVIIVQKPTAAEGVHFGNIVIKTTSQFKPQLIVTVRGIVTKGN
jgi:hypothetical protein